MANDFPQHYAYTAAATIDGLGTGLLHRDSGFVSIASASETRMVTLPSAYPGKTIYGYVDSNGVILRANKNVNGGVNFAIPANYFFEAVQVSESAGWVVSLISSLGTGGLPAGFLTSKAEVTLTNKSGTPLTRKAA